MNTPQGPKKVSEVVSEIKDLLESSFRQVWIVGEISNLSHSSSGHWYFTLSDENAGLSGALFKVDAFRNPEIKNLRDGDQVECFGPLNVYPKRGTFQLIAKRIRAVGKGDLKERFELLKKKLAADGLFDMEAKRPIPKLPQRIAIITAERSAALADFLNICRRRSVWMNITVIPALVQGDAAPASLRRALHQALEYSLKAAPENAFDVIVLARGGGSLEDLWAFNDEGLAYDIFNSPLPIISAVGHQVDFSLSDYVADLRCETPSAAAEVLTAGQVELLKRVNYCQQHLATAMERRLLRLHQKISSMGPHAALDRLRTMLSRAQRRLDVLRPGERALELTGLADKILRLEETLEVLEHKPLAQIEELAQKLESHMALLRALDPKGVLGRGYTYLTGDQGQVLGRAEQFDQQSDQSSFTLHFCDGERKAKRVP